MLQEFLTPVNKDLAKFASELDLFSIGNSIQFNQEIPENAIVIFGVRETRGGTEEFNSELEFNSVRKEFYQLKKGNWHLPVFDLGDLHAGETRQDTYFAFQKILEEILRKKAIPVILGGASNLAYFQYRAFDSVKPNLNLSSIDNRFRLGNDAAELNHQNYLSKIITEKPHNLFEYTHLGFQTYFVAQEELDLMEEMNFDVKRLGKLTENISEAEPELRNSDMVILNLEAIQSSDFKSAVPVSPNGFSAREICSLSRYAGINNKIKSFGVYNYKAKNITADELLISEILWYFIEGKNHAAGNTAFDDEHNFEKYYVQLPEQDLTFFHNFKTEQWWLELKGMNEAEENGAQIIPCSKKDYETSLEGKIPERWWKSYKKLY
jgi:hypothetical protein